MKETVSTGELMRRLVKTKLLSNYFQKNEAFLQEDTFCGLLQSFCDEKHLQTAGIIRAAQIDRTYGYQLFSGARKPSRDKVVMLALGMKLDVEETQRLLRAAGKSALYPRLKRDAVLIHALKSGCSLDETQILLTEYGLSLLGNV